MKNKNYLEVFLNNTKKPVRMAAGIMVAGSVLLSGSIIAEAATLADVLDTKQYADDYADLKEAFGYDEEALLNHYLTYGINERREVSGLIDVVKYRETYADLDAAFGDDWDAYVNHFLTFGVYEGRDSGTDFDALAYAERYSDLKDAFGDNVLALYQHYQTFGKLEGRNAAEEKPYVEQPKTENKNETTNSVSDNIEKNADGTYWKKEYDSKGNVTQKTLYDTDDSVIESHTYKYEYKYISAGHVISHIITKPNGYREETVYNYMVIDWKDGHDVWGYDWLSWMKYDPDTEETWELSANCEMGYYEVEITKKDGTSRSEYYDEDFNLIEDLDTWLDEQGW